MKEEQNQTKVLPHEEVQQAFRDIAPDVNIRTLWSRDPDAKFSDLVECLDAREDPRNWTAWQSEVEVSILKNHVHESAFLGGIWERVSDHPRLSNPDISGYYLQMVREAGERLMDRLPLGVAEAFNIPKLLRFVKKQSQARWEDQQAASRDLASLNPK